MLSMRPIAAGDDAAVASIIRTVMPEFGACGPGFAINDPEVDHMSSTYAAEGACYVVVCDAAGVVVGGGGVAPLLGGPAGVCELRKMYFLKQARGQGAGRLLLRRLLDDAKALGHTRIYLETLTGMDAAMHLYTSFGFEPQQKPLGATGHFSCDRFYARSL